MSVAAPAALGLACAAKTDDDRIFHPTNPPETGGSSGTYDPLAEVSPTIAGSGGMPSSQQCSGEPPAPAYSYCGGGFKCLDGEWQYVGSACNPPTPTCPTNLPVAGSDCGPEGQECLYAVCPPNPSSATCHDGQWAVVYSPGAACNPPAVVDPVCPQRVIVEGANCWFDEQLCSNDAPCVEGTRDGFQCVGGHWQGEQLNCSPAPDAGL